MSASRAQSLATLTSLGVAPVFVQAYLDKHLPNNLDIFLGPPEEFFSLHDRYDEGDLIALLDNGNFDFILYYDPVNKYFVRRYVEDGPDDDLVFSNWQQYLADLIITIAENADDDDELEEIANLIEFKHLAQTLDFLDNGCTGDSTDYERKKWQFLATIN